MPNNPFKITIHMVSSLDGYIAKKDNSIDWFGTTSHYDKGVKLTDEEMQDLVKSIDCYIMGSRTYELAHDLSKQYGWAYGDTPTIVLTHKELPIEQPNIETYAGDLLQLVNERLKPNYKNVWLVGGAQLARDFILAGLADEIRQSILPVILGDGTLFYDQIGREQPLNLKDVTAYKNGMVELRYEVKNDE